MGFKFGLPINKAKSATKAIQRQMADIDVESLQKTLLQRNTSQIEFASQFQKLSDDISKAISTAFFNSQYQETQLIKKLKDLQIQASRAKTPKEIDSIKQALDELINKTNTSNNIKAGNQIGINALINKK